MYVWFWKRDTKHRFESGDGFFIVTNRERTMKMLLVDVAVAIVLCWRIQNCTQIKTTTTTKPKEKETEKLRKCETKLWNNWKFPDSWRLREMFVVFFDIFFWEHATSERCCWYSRCLSISWFVPNNTSVQICLLVVYSISDTISMFVISCPPAYCYGIFVPPQHVSPLKCSSQHTIVVSCETQSTCCSGEDKFTPTTRAKPKSVANRTQVRFLARIFCAQRVHLALRVVNWTTCVFFVSCVFSGWNFKGQLLITCKSLRGCVSTAQCFHKIQVSKRVVVVVVVRVAQQQIPPPTSFIWALSCSKSRRWKTWLKLNNNHIDNVSCKQNQDVFGLLGILCTFWQDPERVVQQNPPSLNTILKVNL